MPAQSFDAFFRSLPKGEPARAYYFHGPEDLLKDEALRAVLDRALDPALRDFNLDLRSAAQLDADSLFALCTTLPMMAERRVVVLREVEALRRKPKVRSALLEYLGRPAPDTVLVLIQSANEENEDKDIAKAAVAVAFEPLPEDRVLRWLDRRAKGWASSCRTMRRATWCALSAASSGRSRRSSTSSRRFPSGSR